MRPVITLTTDFGTRDYYVGTMKGVILSICSDARIVDITHEIEKQEITEAAIVLKSSRRYFPGDTIHVAVVDPGVGGARRPILIHSDSHYFVGPDNGIFSFVLEEDFRAWEITSPQYRLHSVSDTFHGRDVFAPAAAHLALGADPASFGAEVKDVERISTRAPLSYRDRILGEVIHVDSFGNLITNISRQILDEIGDHRSITIEISGRTVRGVSHSYSEVPRGHLVAVFGSTNLLEIAVRDGNAHRKLGVGRGDPAVMFLEG